MIVRTRELGYRSRLTSPPRKRAARETIDSWTVTLSAGMKFLGEPYSLAGLGLGIAWNFALAFSKK
jgi:hypothetical protein